MPFDATQRDLLARDIDPGLLKSRPTGKTKGGEEIHSSYVPGYVAINEANRIFGPHAWSYRLTRLEHVDRTWIAGVLLTVTTPDGDTIEREEVGLTSEQRDTEEEEDKACKGALTDALKRALRTFGPAFGNNLYSGAGRSIGAGDGGQHRPAPVTTDPETGERRDCPTCGKAMQLRSGTTKIGRPWTAWMCPDRACEQKPLWLPDREDAPPARSDADARIITHPAARAPEPDDALLGDVRGPALAKRIRGILDRFYDSEWIDAWVRVEIQRAGKSGLPAFTIAEGRDLQAKAQIVAHDAAEAKAGEAAAPVAAQ